MMTDLLLKLIPERTRSRIEVTESGCWLAPVHPPWKFRIQVKGEDYTVRQYLWKLAGLKKPKGAHLMPFCGYDRCVNPAHCSAPRNRQNGVVRGRQYADLAGKDAEIAARVLQERGYVPAPHWTERAGGHLRIGEYRIWERGRGVSWVEPPSYNSAYRCGLGDHYGAMTGKGV